MGSGAKGYRRPSGDSEASYNSAFFLSGSLRRFYASSNAGTFQFRNVELLGTKLRLRPREFREIIRGETVATPPGTRGYAKMNETHAVGGCHEKM